MLKHLIPLISITALTQWCCLANSVSVDEILALVNCHKEYLFHRPRMEWIQEEGPAQMQRILDINFRMKRDIENCMAKKHEAAQHGKQTQQSREFPPILQLQEEFFQNSGFNEWFSQVQKVLKQEYTELGDEVKINGKTVFDERTGKPLLKTLKHWRRMVIPHGLFLEAIHLRFAKAMLDKLLVEEFHQHTYASESQKAFENLQWFAHRIDKQFENSELISTCSYLSRYSTAKNGFLRDPKYTYEGFYLGVLKKFENALNGVKLDWTGVKAEKIEFDFPKVKRILWIVRHSERVDANPEIKELAKQVGFFENVPGELNKGRKFGTDNPPLSENGRKLAEAKLPPVFNRIKIDHIFASPYERTVHTAHALLRDGHEGLRIKLEPGLVEGLGKGLNFEECEELQKAGYKRLDCSYQQKYNKAKLKEFMAIETDPKTHEEDDICMERAKKVFTDILHDVEKQRLAKLEQSSQHQTQQHAIGGESSSPKFARQHLDKIEISGENAEIMQDVEMQAELSFSKKHSEKGEVNEWVAPGEENAENVVIVSHGTVILALQQILDLKYQYVPLISITKIVEYEDRTKHHPTIEAYDHNLVHFQNLHLEFGSENSHLGVRTKELYQTK